MRIMGLDYGSKTVGVAVSDALGLTAQGIEIVRRKSENKLRQTLARIEEIAKEYGVEKIVLGFPKHMNNDIGERAEKSLEFKEMLERRTGLPRPKAPPRPPFAPVSIFMFGLIQLILPLSVIIDSPAANSHTTTGKFPPKISYFFIVKFSFLFRFSFFVFILQQYLFH